ncbi:MAG: ComEC/Rec2 family competence protein [Patescibacteria group bacterium]|nr:ComEC/Rec2 family competence protein [Patescibacteria group bacterium]
MKNHPLSKIWLASSLAIMGVVFCFIALWPTNNHKLEIDFLSVGQGDAVLIKTPNGKRVLVDAGPGRAVMEKIGYELPFYAKTIDYAILTHAHDDHEAGFIELVKKYKINQFFEGFSESQSKNYLAWQSISKNNDKQLKEGDNLTLDEDVSLKVLEAEDSDGKNPNNDSLVIKLSYKNFSLLLTGDAGKAAEAKMIKEGDDVKADVLKIGHHGSETSSSEDFLKKVNPKLAVISAGQGNMFGHPHEITLRKLNRLKIAFRRTDLAGTIKVISDGYGFNEE